LVFGPISFFNPPVPEMSKIITRGILGMSIINLSLGMAIIPLLKVKKYDSRNMGAKALAGKRAPCRGGG
jgi:hypothetical protein